MKFDDMNKELRLLFKKYIDQGFKKGSIAGTTFGTSCTPHFDRFIKENNVGIVILNKIIGNLGYDLHLIVTKKEDNQHDNYLKSLDNSFLINVDESLDNFLNGRIEKKELTTSTKKINTLIDEEVKDFLDEILDIDT